MKTIYYANTNRKFEKKVDSRKMYTVKKKKDCHFIMMTGSIYQYDIPILSVYTPNTWAYKYMNQKMKKLQEEIGNFTITVGDFNIPLSILYKK